jgi:hypothetical protein
MSELKWARVNIAILPLPQGKFLGCVHTHYVTDDCFGRGKFKREGDEITQYHGFVKFTREENNKINASPDGYLTPKGPCYNYGMNLFAIESVKKEGELIILQRVGDFAHGYDFVRLHIPVTRVDC